MFYYMHSKTGSLYKPVRPLGLVITSEGRYEIELRFGSKVCYLNQKCFEFSLLLDKNPMYVLHKKGPMHNVWKEWANAQDFV